MHTHTATDTDRSVITLSKKEARALLEFASDDVTRESLAGVCFRVAADDRRVEAVATDGHTLAILRSADPIATDAPRLIPITIAQGYAIVPRAALARAMKSCGSKESIAIAFTHDQTVRAVISCVPHAGRKGEGEPMLAAPTSTASTECADLQYPDVGAVLKTAPRRENEPTETGEATGAAIVGLNPHYLARLALLSDACEQGKGPSVRLSIARGEFRHAGHGHDAGWQAVHPIRADIVGFASSAIALIMPIRLEEEREMQMSTYFINDHTLADLRSIAYGHLRSALRWVRASRRVSVATRCEYTALALGQYRDARGMTRVLTSLDPRAHAALARRLAQISRIVDDALRGASDGVRVALYALPPV